MSFVVDVQADGVRVPLSRSRVRQIAQLVLRDARRGDAMLSVTFVSRAAIARLNRRHLGTSGSTDVIAFGWPSGGGAVVGDVYVAPDVARANAKVHGAGVREELARLIVHGTLHVLGDDHPDGDARMASPMWRRQERLLRRARQRGAW
jgi:probable rRNA maturation factor